MREARFAPSPFVSMAELQGEAVLLDERSGRYFGLDSVASDVWRLIARGLSRAEIVGALLAEYDVDSARLEHDVTRLLETLCQRQLVVEYDAISGVSAASGSLDGRL